MDESTSVSGAAMPGGQLPEQLILQRVEERWAELRTKHPEYFAYLEDVDPDLASRAEVTDLMRCAPSPEILMFIYAKFTTRLQLAAITGREFA